MAGEASTVAETVDRPKKKAANDDPEQVGRFAIQRRLGAGAMGVVLVGRDDTLDREVAIKLVRPGKRSDGAKLRLLREAQAMARVAHPNVVTVYEAGLHEEGVYIAMELVHGQALDEWLKAETRSVAAILACFVQAGRGLAAAHAKGIIHRDFKPANVLVGNDGRTRVGDFGLARGAAVVEDDSAHDVAAPEESGSSHRASSGNVLAAELTGRGAMLGTPAYMSLEHFRGKAVAASDQWSFGVALYRALYNVAPYSGDGLLGQYEAVLNDPVRAPAAAPEVDPRIVSAMMRAISKEANDRWPSMDALVAEIEGVLGIDPDNDPHRSRRQRFFLAIGLTVFALVNGLVAAFRSGFGMEMGLGYTFVQSTAAFVAVAIGTFVFRRTVLRDAHGRRLVLVLFLVLGTVSLHRLVALFSETSIVAVLRGDAISVASIGILASVVLERWLISTTAFMALFMVISLAWPPASVPAFGVTIVSSLALGIWFWREPPPMSK